jgi:hypothetical protein
MEKHIAPQEGIQPMKAYLFNVENGLYLGETFEEPDILVSGDGVTPISPPDYERDEMPMFDRQNKSWGVIPVTATRQLIATDRVTITERHQ